MTAVQIPFVVALAGKNNVISFLTGLSHEKVSLLFRLCPPPIIQLLKDISAQRCPSGCRAHPSCDQLASCGRRIVGVYQESCRLSFREYLTLEMSSKY